MLARSSSRSTPKQDCTRPQVRREPSLLRRARQHSARLRADRRRRARTRISRDVAARLFGARRGGDLLDPDQSRRRQFPRRERTSLIGRKRRWRNETELEDWLPSVAKADDRVLIYFAGTASSKAAAAYLAPYDLDPCEHRGDRLSDGHAGHVAARDQSQVEGPADGRLPQRRDHSGSRRRSVNQSLLDLSRRCSRSRPAATANDRLKARIGAAATASSLITS